MNRVGPRIAVAVLVATLTACEPDRSSFAPEFGIEDRQVTAPPDLVKVATITGSVTLWPYLSDNLSSTPADPINLIISGKADPRDVRAGLLALNGDRSAIGFPTVAPFDCVWTDAIGGVMMGFGPWAGWVGGAVQLQCGGFGPIRFHLRLFDLGDFTIGNAHFEVLIPGTTDHQVLSWELGEQLVAGDLARTGLLGASPAATQAITKAPFRTIPTVIYNGLPPALRQLVGGPPAPVTTAVPIGSDGRATVLVLAGRAPSKPGPAIQQFVINFDQIVPKPFRASGPNDLLLVRGPVRFRQVVAANARGELVGEVDISGELELRPATGGDPHRATVSETQRNLVTDAGGTIIGQVRQVELPRGQPGHGSLTVEVSMAPGRTPFYLRSVECTS